MVQTYPQPQVPLFFVRELPHEQAGTGAGGAEPPCLDRRIADRRRLACASPRRLSNSDQFSGCVRCHSANWDLP